MKESVLIFGMAGTIGSELARQLSKKYFVYGVDLNESRLHDLIVETGVQGRVGDIRNYDTVDDVFSDIKPKRVFHAAAYKCVDMMELVPLEAIKTNGEGTYNILHCASRYETEKLVYISTDKVVNAKSVMGQTKKLGETMTVNQGYTAVRFGNVLNSQGSVIPIWQRQIDSAQPITITDERMTRYMMTTEEACELVIEAGDKSQGKEVWVMDMGEPIKIIDLAREIIAKSGRDIPIKMIGRRVGETLDEKLMTEEEEKIAVRKGKFFIIKNQL